MIWGLYFAVFLTLEKFWLGKHLKKNDILARIYVIIFILISFVIFNATSMSDAVTCIGGMFGIGTDKLISTETIYYLRSYGVVVLAGIVGATPIVKNVVLKIKENKQFNKIINILEIIVVIGIILICTAYLVDGSFNPFLYFRF